MLLLAPFLISFCLPCSRGNLPAADQGFAPGNALAPANAIRWNDQLRQFDLVRDSGAAWLSHGRLSVVLSDQRRISSDGARYRGACRTNAGESTIAFSDTQQQLDLALAVQPAGDGAIILKATIANRGHEPLALDRIEVLCGRLAGQRDPAKPGVLLSGRSMGHNLRAGACGNLESHYTLAQQSPPLAAGFLTGLHNINRFTLTPNLELTAWGECNGALLPAGRSRETDLLFLSVRPNPLQEMERFADLAAQVNHARLWPTNFATWCSWYSGWLMDRAGSFQHGLEKGVEQNIGPVRELSGNRDATAAYAMRICEDGSMYGDWNDVTKHIPHGLTRLARMIRQGGIVPGVWYTPYWASLDSRVHQDHPGWMARNADGTEFREKLEGLEATRTTGGEFAILDSTNPQVLAYFEQMAHQWRDRGFRYVSNDFLTCGLLPPSYHDPTKTKAEAFRLGMEATRKGLGGDVFFRAINALFGPSMGLPQDMRVGADSFGDVVSAYEVVGSLWFYNHRLWLNDPESIVVRGKSMEWNTMWASWIALAGTVMTYGDRLGELPAEYRDFYHRIFPPLNTPGRPLDLWENEPFLLWGMVPANSPGMAADAADGPYELFGVFELTGGRNGQVSLNLDEISARCRGWEKPQQAPGQYLVWDFWQQRLLNPKGAAMTIPMPSKSGRLFALRAKLSRPQLLSTSGHFSQGLLETSDIRWDAKTSTLSGKTRGNGGQATILYFHVPTGMKLIEARIEENPRQAEGPQPNVIALPVPAGAEWVEFHLVFGGQAEETIGSRPFVLGRAATPASEH